MEPTVIAFLVLLGGTPAEHVIEMTSLDDCRRAAESVIQAQCLNEGEFDAHLRENGRENGGAETDLQPASEPAIAPGALENLPSATARRIRKVLDPQPDHRPRLRMNGRKE